MLRLFSCKVLVRCELTTCTKFDTIVAGENAMQVEDTGHLISLELANVQVVDVMKLPISDKFDNLERACNSDGDV